MADLPTPPENPFESTPDFESLNNGNGGPEQQLPQGGPEVAAKASRAMVVFGVMALVLILLLYSIFSGGKKEDEKPEPTKIIPAVKNDPPALPVVEPTAPVVPPPVLAPPPIPVPVAVPDLKDINVNPLSPKEDAAVKAQAAARLKSGLMMKDDGGDSAPSSLLSGSSSTTSSGPSDPNSQFAASVGKSKVERVKATSIGDLHRTIAQGRIIQATMESALNTDLPAPIRAIVSRDTYAEAGNTPLIPKGSRLIGSYNTTLGSGQTRVFVVWTRVIRPDGVDVALGSPLTDAIGQAGISGQLDTKFQQMFARSLLSSVMNIAVAIGADKIQGGDTTTTTTTTGSQTSGDAATTATTNALNRLGSVTDSFIQKFISVPPTILVDQGTPVNVFVNKDIVFPGDTAGVHVVY